MLYSLLNHFVYGDDHAKCRRGTLFKLAIASVSAYSHNFSFLAEEIDEAQDCSLSWAVRL